MDTQRGSATVPVVKEVTLRLARPDERRRWDALMDQHHPLGFKQFAGRGLRYVAIWQGEWLALLGWQTGVFQCRPREQWLGWHKAVQFQRLHLIANNTRFVMLPEGTGVKNLASRLLGLNLRRLSADWQAHWGHPLELAETFVEPQKYRGTVYLASNWIKLGLSKGYARSNGKYTDKHGQRKVMLVVRPGRVREVQVLCGKGSNQSIPLPEPCGRSREGTGEASAGAHVGRANEQRNTLNSECRGRHQGRRQYCSDRFGEVREGSAVSENPGTHVCTNPGLGIPPRYHGALRRGRRSEGRSRSEDERRGGVGLGHSSDETSEQSVECHVAELAERRAGRNGRREGKARLRTQSREAPRWVRCWTGTERHGSSRGVPS